MLLAPAFDLRESHTTEQRLARSPVRSPCPWRAELCSSVPWAAWSVPWQDREHGTPWRGYPEPAPGLGNGCAAVKRPDQLSPACMDLDLPSCLLLLLPIFQGTEWATGDAQLLSGKVVLMLAVTLCWRKRCEDEGLQNPEEASGNLFCSRWAQPAG